MQIFGDHAAFIIPSYIISVVVLGALVLFLRVQYSNRKKELAELEKAGIKRRAK